MVLGSAGIAMVLGCARVIYGITTVLVSAGVIYGIAMVLGCAGITTVLVSAGVIYGIAMVLFQGLSQVSSCMPFGQAVSWKPTMWTSKNFHSRILP